MPIVLLLKSKWTQEGWLRSGRGTAVADNASFLDPTLTFLPLSLCHSPFPPHTAQLSPALSYWHWGFGHHWHAAAAACHGGQTLLNGRLPFAITAKLGAPLDHEYSWHRRPVELGPDLFFSSVSQPIAYSSLIFRFIQNKSTLFKGQHQKIRFPLAFCSFDSFLETFSHPSLLHKTVSISRRYFDARPNWWLSTEISYKQPCP